jgi:acetolactate synthase I/II/III large subunit
MLFHEAAARSFADQGIDTIFGLIGDGNLYMMDSFQRAAGGTYYSFANEASGVLAASGYASTSGKLGVATVTHGPAFTNTVTPLIEGVKSHTPILLIAGDTAVLDRENLQNISQRDITIAAGAGFEQVRAPGTIAEDVATAVRRAWAERRPIVLNVPVEFQWQEVDYTPAPVRHIAPQAVAPDPAVLEEAVGLIAGSNRPIVLAGQGAANAEARAALVRLAHRIGAPLATTLRGRELFLGEPHNLGIFGTLSHEVALDAISQADLVIAFGASLNYLTADRGGTLAGKKIVQVDTERAALNQFSPIHLGIVGDSVTAAAGLVELLDEAEVKPTGFASPQLAERLASYHGAEYADMSTEHTVDIRTAVRMIDQVLPGDRTFVTDVGRFMVTALANVHVREPRAYVHTASFGAIGLGMANAIGAYFGAPGRPVLLVTGDGGFMLGGLTEFSAAVRHGADVVVCVLNDGAYGAEHIQFRRKDMDPAISTFPWPDLGPIATDLGGRGFTVHNVEELAAALHAIETRDRPVLIDIKIDPDKVTAPGH